MCHCLLLFPIDVVCSLVLHTYICTKVNLKRVPVKQIPVSSSCFAHLKFQRWDLFSNYKTKATHLFFFLEIYFVEYMHKTEIKCTKMLQNISNAPRAYNKFYFYDMDPHALIRVNANGQVGWYPISEVETSCDFRVATYPLDIQECFFQVQGQLPCGYTCTCSRLYICSV